MIFVLTLLLSCKKSEETVASQVKKPTHTIAKTHVSQEECDADFDVFFRKFARDSIFQMKHIKFPLKDSYPSDDYSKTNTDYVALKDCEYFDFTKDKEAYKKETDAYSVKDIKNQDTVFYNWRGVDNGIYIDFKFVFTNGCWQMVEISDHST